MNQSVFCQKCEPIWTPVDITITVIYIGCAIGLSVTTILLLFVLLHQINMHFYTMPRIEKKITNLFILMEPTFPQNKVKI
jgi:hypothetical protein